MKKLIAFIFIISPSAYAGVHVQVGSPITTSSVTITGTGIRFADGTVQVTSAPLTVSGSGSGGVSVYPASATAAFPYGFTVSTVATSGSGAGQWDFTEGADTGVSGAASSHDILWADSTSHTFKFNPNNTSTFTVAGSSSPPTAGNLARWGNTSGALVDGGPIGTGSVSVYPATSTIQANYGVNTTTITITDISTMTVSLVYMDNTAGHFGLPTRTSAQIALLQPLFAGVGNIIRCSDCTSGKVCIDTGTVAGAWGIIQSTGVACR